MAVKDVREYYYNLLMQKIEMKQDLADFEQAFKDGQVTEDKLANVKETIDAIEQNFNRVSYIMYLLELPNRPSKQQKARKRNKKLEAAFKDRKADYEAIKEENNSALDALRDELKALTEEKNS